MNFKTHQKRNESSSPVAGTNGNNHLGRETPSALSENLSRQEFSQACNALAQCAAALTALASVIGKGDSAPASRLSLPHDRVPLVDAVSEFMRAKARAGRSDRYLRALRVSLGSFIQGRAAVDVRDVCLADVESWLDGREWSPRTQKGYLSDVRVFYSWAMKRGMVTHNPAAAVELVKPDTGPVVIHSPAEVRTVLQFARAYDLNLCRCLAVRYFAGLRSAEADRLREAEILPGHIEVTAAKAKTRRRRLVTIQPALRAWLALGGSLEFGDRGNRWRWFTASLRAKTGLEWSHNVTRHTFCSYHLAEFQSAAKTALEAGHAEAMLFAHYREIVTPGTAREFWELRPTVGA